MGFLSRKDVISAPARFAVKEAAVRDWGGGGSVLVQGGSGEDRDEYETQCLVLKHNSKGKVTGRETNLKLVRRMLVALACVEAPEDFEMPADGRALKLPRLFTLEDVNALAERSGRDLDTVFTVARELWGIGESDVEELAGESKPGLSAGRGTGLPVNGAVLALSSNES